MSHYHRGEFQTRALHGSHCLSRKCDWACENQAYLHKLHMFKKNIFLGLCL